jgi:hypothetical protein
MPVKNPPKSDKKPDNPVVKKPLKMSLENPADGLLWKEVLADGSKITVSILAALFSPDPLIKFPTIFTEFERLDALKHQHSEARSKSNPTNNNSHRQCLLISQFHANNNSHKNDNNKS